MGNYTNFTNWLTCEHRKSPKMNTLLACPSMLLVGFLVTDTSGKPKQCLAKGQKCCQFPGIHGKNKWECDPVETNKGKTCCDGMNCTGAEMGSALPRGASRCPP